MVDTSKTLVSLAWIGPCNDGTSPGTQPELAGGVLTDLTFSSKSRPRRRTHDVNKRRTPHMKHLPDRHPQDNTAKGKDTHELDVRGEPRQHDSPLSEHQRTIDSFDP